MQKERIVRKIHCVVFNNVLISSTVLWVFLLVPLSLFLQGPVISGGEEINEDIIKNYTMYTMIFFFL